MARRERVWIALGGYDGVEGPVVAMLKTPINTWELMPLFTTDPKNLDAIMELAERASRTEKRRIVVASFDHRTDHAIYDPGLASRETGQGGPTQTTKGGTNT